MKMRKLFAGVIAAATAVTAMAVAASAADYNGYIYYQTVTYSFRNEFNDPTYGKDAGFYDYMIVWGDKNTDPDTYPGYEDTFDYDLGAYLLPATYTDTTITGDGTYTVKAEGIDWNIKSDAGFNIVGISTDIPFNEAITVTSAKILVDGVEVRTVSDVAVEPNKDYCVFNIASVYNDMGGLEAYPTSSLEVEFTIAGLGAAGGAGADGKDNSDTGVEGLAVVAGLAIVAAGAIVVAKKRG